MERHTGVLPFPTSIIRRLLTPIMLIGPLMALVAVPAIAYGLSSNRAVASADAALMNSFVTNGDYLTVNSTFVCPNVRLRPEALTFRSLDLVPRAHKTSLTSVGFDKAKADISGLSGRVPIAIRPDTISSTSKAIDDRITVELHRSRGDWCLYDISIADEA